MYFSNDLMERIAVYGDARAYKQFFYHFYPRLLSFSESLLRNRESAEEVVSDVFTKIWNNRTSLPTIENIELYLYVITKNHSLNRLLADKRKAHLELNEKHYSLRSMNYDPEQLLITAEMFRKVQTAIQQLPPRCRLIFKLIKEDGWSYRQVAELLNISVKTVENQMTIAIKKLAHSIQFRKPTSASL